MKRGMIPGGFYWRMMLARTRRTGGAEVRSRSVMMARASRFRRSPQANPLIEPGWQVAESGYVRPPIETPIFLDDTGEVIPFGARWGDDGPPEEAYSVVHHPERFAPLLTVAEAMIAHVTQNR